MGHSPGQEPTIRNEIKNLISELRYNPQGIFKERHHDQEAAKSRQISVEG
jgi:hypothetical protein